MIFGRSGGGALSRVVLGKMAFYRMWVGDTYYVRDFFHGLMPMVTDISLLRSLMGAGVW